MDICMTCGTIEETSFKTVECENGCGNLLHLGRCGGCGVELGYTLDDALYSPEQLACSLCVKRAMRKAAI